MERNITRLAEETFDILIVGGGIHGAAIVREAAARGFKAALIEQGDFGQATSSNSQKIIHGGLRYLQQADFKRMRQSITARRTFMQMAPHLVKPFPFLIPIYGHGLRGKETMSIALTINDLLSWDRNRSVHPGNFLPRGKVISREECLEILPHIEKRGLTGGAVWYDGLVANTERLTLEWILAAAEGEAAVANYVRAKALIIEKEAVTGLEVEDRASHTAFTIRSRWVINSTGPWLNSLITSALQTDPLPMDWTKGINLIINRSLFSGYGVGLGGGQFQKTPQSPLKKKQRLFFFVPWQGRTMVGVAYKRYKGDPEQCRMEVEDIREFIAELNSIYPPGRLTTQEVSFFHCGLLPVSENQDHADDYPEPDRHSRFIDHEPLMHFKGLISVKSTKYTTAPLVAEKVVDLISTKEKTTAGPFLKSKSPFFYDQVALLDDLNRFCHGKTGEDQDKIALHLFQNYGSHSKRIMDYLQEDPQASRLISEDPPIMAAEIVHGVREEMAIKLSDVIFRRTALGQFQCPPMENLQAAAKIMAEELGWNDRRTQEEIREVLDVYQPLRHLRDE